jgi:branched-chain amino acid transport system substrate-binding protein
MPAPIRIGVLRDVPRQPGVEPGSDVMTRAFRLAIDEIGDRLDAEVELVEEWAEGLPAGTAWAVEQGMDSLAGQGVLAIVGPAIGDNALVATPLADELEIPTINWAGTERARSEWMFHIQVGSHEDEGILLARHLQATGVGRVGVAYDRSAIGRRYLGFFEDECDLLGIAVSARVGLAVQPDDATAEVTAIRETSPDALVQLGLGFAGLAVARARTEVGWDVPACGNTWGLRGYGDAGRVMDGWTYVDLVSDRNSTLAHAKAALGIDGFVGTGLAYGYDAGRLVAEAVVRAPERTRAGVRDGLELVKMLPAAEGKEGTVLGFGHMERGALKGHYLVLRQWRDGATVEL